MPNFLSVADWKAVLNKPKNAGLKAQGTGVSEKLRDYEAAKFKLNSAWNRANVQGALQAVQDLKKHVDKEKTKHSAFTEATKYLQDVAKAAAAREVDLLKEVGLLGSVDTIKDALAKAIDQIKGIKTYEAFADMDTKSVLQKVRTIGASCAKVPELAQFGSQSGNFTKDGAITQENWQEMQAGVARWLLVVKAAVAKL